MNTNRIKLIGTFYHSSPFNLWKSLLMLVFVGDLRISVSPKHPTGSKAKRTFCDCSSNISTSNSLPLSLQTSIFSLQELKKSLPSDSLPLLAAHYKIRNAGIRNNGTQNTGGTLVEHWRNTDGTLEHWRSNGTMKEQSEYHEILSRYHNKIQNKKVI